MESGISNSLSFAERISGKYKRFGRYEVTEAPRVFVRRDAERFPAAHAAKNTWLQFQLKLFWQKNTAGPSPKNQLFYNISTIFENRERQPDQAKKAEKKLIRILANDFFGNLENVTMFRNALLGTEWGGIRRMNQKTPAKEWEKIYRYGWRFHETEEAVEQKHILKRQTYQENELEQAREQMEELNRRVTVQEKLLRELRQTPAVGQELAPAQVDGIARRVMKKVEREMYQERLRRGLY